MSRSSRRWAAQGACAALLALLFWGTTILASETPTIARVGVNVHSLGLADYRAEPPRPVAPLNNRIVADAAQDAQALGQPDPSDSGVPSATSGPSSGSDPSPSPSSAPSPSPSSAAPTAAATATPSPTPIPAPPSGGAVGWVQGRVQDSVTSHGIAGALVQTVGASTTCDSTGAYQLTLPGGTYTVTASAGGYTSQTQTVTVTAASSVKLDFSLTPITVSPGTISGVVYNGQTGVGIAGATVSLSPSGLVVSTGSAGNYLFVSVPPGSYTITASAGGFKSASTGVSVTSGHNSVVNLKLQPLATTGSVVGTVKGSNGKAIAGATVTLTPGALSTVTDANGYYGFPSVLPGTYTVTVSAPGYLTQSATVTVQAGKTVKANFSLTPG